MTQIQTGVIIPRDYGIRLRQNGVFISPSKYALGRLLLATPAQRQRWVSDVAAEKELSVDETVEWIARGFKKRKEDPAILDAKTTLFDVRRYGDTIAGKALSRRDPDTYHEMQLASPFESDAGYGYTDARCSCGNGFWDGVKNAESMCPHLAALETALYEDVKQRRSIAGSHTGLPPRNRFAAPSLPFYERGGASRAVTRYYGGENHFSLNKDLLEDIRIYASLVQGLVQEGKAEFQVMRHAERNVDAARIRESERRYHGAVKALQRRIHGMLKAHGFRKTGYVLEFKGTPHEAVAQRFMNGFAAYSVCIGRDAPPLLVMKHLGPVVPDPISAREVRQDDPYFRAQSYITVDDATRRECRAEVILPGMRDESRVFVPQLLQDVYRQRMRQL